VIGGGPLKPTAREEPRQSVRVSILPVLPIEPLPPLATKTNMSNTHTLVSRRQFCAGGRQVASCATLAALASACGGSSPTSPTSPGGGASALGVLQGQFAGSAVEVTTTGSALADVGGAALVESIAGVFLVARTGASAFAAVDAICTHESCTITSAAGDIYVCPCHGSRYTRSGQVVGGPAQASLRQYATSFANGIVTIAV
jgi:Rieske Fe-S protein